MLSKTHADALGPLQSVAAVTMLRAADLDAAIAKIHPALDFGTTIEVRRVAPLPVAPLPDRPVVPVVP